MRRGNKPELIYDETRKTDGKPLLLGVNLSADFCAEHEWGIKDIRMAFGLPDETGIHGINRRQITAAPKGLAWVKYAAKTYVGRYDVERGLAKKTGDVTLKNEGFVFHSSYGLEPERLARSSELSGLGLRGAWSEDDFAVVSNNPDEIAALREIFAEFEKKNIVICMSGAMAAFDNAGLVLAIASRLSVKVCEDWYNHDREQEQIKKEFTATGIEKTLKAAGKRYYALSPRRFEDGSLKFWLNPMEQQQNNYGWFTLEDLQAWSRGEGPIPMIKKS